jgi:hypothetical protein
VYRSAGKCVGAAAAAKLRGSVARNPSGPRCMTLDVTSTHRHIEAKMPATLQDNPATQTRSIDVTIRHARSGLQASGVPLGKKPPLPSFAPTVTMLIACCGERLNVRPTTSVGIILTPLKGCR